MSGDTVVGDACREEVLVTFLAGGVRNVGDGVFEFRLLFPVECVLGQFRPYILYA